MSEHTPGPWELHGTLVAKFGENHAMICQLSEPRVSTEAKHHELRIMSPDRAEAAANAHLIVAAPELLAVCETAVADAAGATNPSSRLPNYKAMQAAIAKAKELK